MEKFQSEIVEIESLNPSVKHFVLNVPEDFAFVPGQYVSFILDQDGKKLRRPYSICSVPNGNTIDLCIKILENGVATPTIDKLKVGAKIELLGPLGDFVIENKEKNLVFVAGGTGIGPFRSMIPWLLKNDFKKNITLIAGYRDTILYDKEFKKLSEDYQNFTYKTILSPGRVQELLSEVQTEDTDFYLCGLKDMINSVRSLLVKQGVPMSSIFSEKYD